MRCEGKYYLFRNLVFADDRFKGAKPIYVGRNLPRLQRDSKLKVDIHSNKLSILYLTKQKKEIVAKDFKVQKIDGNTAIVLGGGFITISIFNLWTKSTNQEMEVMTYTTNT
jgi:hypothetical protein